MYLKKLIKLIVIRKNSSNHTSHIKNKVKFQTHKLNVRYNKLKDHKIFAIKMYRISLFYHINVHLFKLFFLNSFSWLQILKKQI